MKKILDTTPTKTTLELYLSTGNKISIYFAVDCNDSIEKELFDRIFFPGNWEIEQMIIEDGHGNLLFGNDAGDPDIISGNKIIAWSIRDRNK